MAIAPSNCPGIFKLWDRRILGFDLANLKSLSLHDILWNFYEYN